MTELKHHLPGEELSHFLPTSWTTRRGAPTTSERQWAQGHRTRLLVNDLAVIGSSLGLAYVIRSLVETASTGATWVTTYAVASVIILVTWIAALGAHRTRDIRVIGIGAGEYKRVINASMVAFAILGVLLFAVQAEVSRAFFFTAMGIGTLGLVSTRWMWRHWLIRQPARDRFLSRAIVVGGTDEAEYVVRQINEKSRASYNVVAATVSDATTTHIEVGDRRVPIVGEPNSVSTIARNLQADTVIVAGAASRNPSFIRSLSWDLEGTGTELVLAAQLTDVAGPRIHFRPVDGLPLMHVEIPQFDGMKHALKRSFDVVASGIGLLILAPLFGIIAILVHLDSPGGVLFRQERVGRGERSFTMLKFRTMVATAEQDLAALLVENEGNGLLFKMKNDPRVTRIGRVLRKYSLDELPQLWNVFVGDMSLVGPRPPLPREVIDYESHVRRRLYIKPGLTGMWQVGGRSDLSWEESVRLDLYYVENWSLVGDLMILWQTVKVVTRPTGAY
ncbi:Undecaprenyl-phosphate galactose phosphotransferase WbaP/exopolysaccharide biosynthesis polyprenyl glycosylphosphotransferase [Labedella gwakjiensis]|uniref:Sugar transferase n=1 Tax=Labedella gwakjiensis TaxID=390269 RepID=A0A2P8GSF6_9MICO|nr:sugar transferase [Labedella gwakjiensis]PSL36885.1 Undecaprenyl-phosphate galactose phosphotransferase WbaP/exopolysaccharide biosynthesis polyprenyl glycosylphosphotransferase [Labedella gwakjiensis]RUQ84382.1 sugar transferase [Labedella gwakjiensis]